MHASPRSRGFWTCLVLLAIAVQVAMVFLLDLVLLSSIQAPVLPAERRRLEVALVPEAKPTKKQQIVRNDALVKEKAPKDAKRRSEFDNTVERETRAPRGRPRPRLAQRPTAQKSSRAARSNKPLRPSPPEVRTKSRTSNAGASSPAKPGALVRLDNLGRLVPKSDGAQVQKTAEASSATRREPSQGEGRRLRLSDRQRMAQLFGPSGTMQDLNDVEQGDKTRLNTKRSRYASFFNRVRDAIAQHWHPDVLHRAHDPYGKIYGTKDRTTKVIIVLRPDGSVLRVRTTGACGVDYLDEEAVRAIWAAQPFTNPPKDLVDGMTGRIEFGFAFTLEFGGRSRIFRMRK